MNPRWSANLPPPLFVSVNMKSPELENTDRIAFGFVLVASIVSRPAFQVAFVIRTVSAAGGAPGVRVIVVVRVIANHDAVIVTVVVAVTGDVLTANAPVDWPPLTTVSAGTRT